MRPSVVNQYFASDPRPSRMALSQLYLTRQQRLRVVPTVMPVYVNSDHATTHPFASGGHKVIDHINYNVRNYERQSLTERMPVQPISDDLDEEQKAALMAQPQVPGAAAPYKPPKRTSKKLVFS